MTPQITSKCVCRREATLPEFRVALISALIALTAGAGGCGSQATGPTTMGPTTIKYTENILHTFSGGADGIAQSPLILDGNGNLYGTNSGGVGNGEVFELSPPTGGNGSWTKAVLYSFTGGTDGGVPSGPLLFDSAGDLYGATIFGGLLSCSIFPTVPGCGVVFKLSPPLNHTGAWTETVLYAFTGGTDAAGPIVEVSDSKGNLYGFTQQLGQSCGGAVLSCGTIFELSPPVSGTGSWTETVLHSFTGGNDGASPRGLAVDAQGNLYGTTKYGGISLSCSEVWTTPGCGVAFRFSPPASGAGPWTETVLYSFTGQSDGGFPSAGIILDSGGNLYGTTSAGGLLNDCSFSFAHDFTPPPGCGVVFKLSLPANGAGSWTETVLNSFTGGTDGAYPGALVFDAQGRLYSVTFNGGLPSPPGACPSTPQVFGSGSTPGGCGVVFRLDPPGSGSALWSETKLYSFAGGTDGGYTSVTPGGFPSLGVIIDSNGNLYGTTNCGGDASCPAGGSGVIFELVPTIVATQ